MSATPRAPRRTVGRWGRSTPRGRRSENRRFRACGLGCERGGQKTTSSVCRGDNGRPDRGSMEHDPRTCLSRCHARSGTRLRGDVRPGQAHHRLDARIPFVAAGTVPGDPDRATCSSSSGTGWRITPKDSEDRPSIRNGADSCIISTTRSRSWSTTSRLSAFDDGVAGRELVLPPAMAGVDAPVTMDDEVASAVTRPDPLLLSQDVRSRARRLARTMVLGSRPNMPGRPRSSEHQRRLARSRRRYASLELTDAR